MGFGDFSSFSQDLVAKQEWRILHNRDSLMAKILKVKYFKHTGFIEVKLRLNLPFVWKSILWGRQMFYKGLWWRIGNGNQVSVFSSNWIQKSRLPSFAPYPNLPTGAVVANFFNDKNLWNEYMIDQYFLKEVVKRILRLFF